MAKAAEAFRTISEVADDLEVPKHVLRFWEAKFPQVRPMKRGGGRRYYRPEDMELLRGIRRLLHSEGYTIKGVQKILREQGIDHVKLHGVEPVPVPAAKGRGRPKSAPGASVAETLVVVSAADGAGISRKLKIERSAGLDAILKAAIVELEACRRVLAGEPNSALATHTVAPVAAAPRRSRAGRA